jgi:hypothetical protein
VNGSMDLRNLEALRHGDGIADLGPARIAAER